MKELIFIQACPDDTYYIWQTHTWLESLRKLGKSDKAINLIFIPNNREKNTKWNQLIELYPESEFFFYKDTENITRLLPFYIPLLRPYILAKYFELHPELKEKAIFYCDNDIVFTDKFNIDNYVNNEINYVSNTNSYINASYFDSKVKDVLPDKLEEFLKKDILQEATALVGVTREIAVKNNEHSGGAQYLLKNIDADFWKKVMENSLKIRLYLQDINSKFFENESKGFQSWCADMWAVLWKLWEKNQEVKVIPEMEFAWSSDNISKIENIGILHNAGIVGETQGDVPVFYKGKYHSGLDPFQDEYFYSVLNNEKNKTLCNSVYVQAMNELKLKYNLKY